MSGEHPQIAQITQTKKRKEAGVGLWSLGFGLWSWNEPLISASPKSKVQSPKSKALRPKAKGQKASFLCLFCLRNLCNLWIALEHPRISPVISFCPNLNHTPVVRYL